MYAQLDFTNNPYKRVELIGGEEVGIIQQLIDQYPTNFVNMDGRSDVSEINNDNYSLYYYDVENDSFITFDQVPPMEEEVIIPEPSNTDIAQMISDLQADMMIATSQGGM